MRAGKLRKRIGIHSLIHTRSTISGEMKQSWSSFSSVWAGVDYINSGESFGSIGTPIRTLDTKILFTLRYSTGIEPNMRIIYKSDYYDIKSIENVDQRNTELRIMGELSE